MKAFKGLTEKVYKGEGGFTLIELLIVIIILGILAAVVAFNVAGFLGAGTEETAKTEKASMQTAIISCMAACSVGEVVGASNATGTPSGAGWDTQVANATGDEGKLSNYLQSDLHGYYTWDTDGVIDNACYSGGGKKCVYNGTTWDDCSGTGDCSSATG